MKRFFKRLLIIFVLFFVVLLGAAAILASLFEDQIGRKIITEVNKQLKSELTVDKFDLTVVRSFPNVAANLRGVALADSRDGELLRAGNLSFRFGLLSLLSSDIKVKSVVLKDASVKVLVDRKGSANYDIFVESEEEQAPQEKSGKGPAISLESARLVNVELIYKDESASQNMAVNISDASFSGKFSSTKFSLTSEAELFSRYIGIDKLRYLVNKNLAYDARIFVDLEEKVYKVEELKLEVEGNVFQADGSVETWDKGTYLDLFFTGDRTDLSSVIALLPDEYLKNLSDFKSNGNFEFNAAVKGLVNERENPEIKVELSMEDGRISSPRMDSPLKDVSFIASFNNGKKHDNSTSVFQLQNLSGYFKRERFEMRLRVDNFDDPDIDFLMDGIVPMDAVYGLFNNKKITDGGGEIEIQQLLLKGRYQDMINTSRVNRIEAGGQLEFDDAYLVINEEKLLLDRGQLQMEGNKLSVQDLKLEGPGTEISFKGYAYNIIPVLFADSLNSKRAELEFQADLQSESLDIDRLIKMAALSEEAEAAPEPVRDSLKEANIQQRERITNFLKGSFNAVIQNYNYNLIEGKDFVGKLEFDNSKMLIAGETQAMEGKFLLEGTVKFEEKPSLEAKLYCDGINVEEFFRQTENFGQDVLTYKNLEGTLHSRMLIYAYWDQQGNFLTDELRVLAGLGIENGELVDFKLLESFSTFVNVRDLQYIRFTNMENFLEVRNRRLYLPAMFIQSNALNLTISGEHSFDQEIKYYMKVNAGQVLAERFKKHDPSLRPVKASKRGFFNLHYAILGTIDDYNIKSAKRMVKSDFERSENRKRKIQQELERAFGIVELVEEPEDWRDIPEYQEGNGNQEDKFIWEDDPATDQNEEYIEWEENDDGGNSSTHIDKREEEGNEVGFTQHEPEQQSRPASKRSSVFSSSALFKPKREYDDAPDNKARTSRQDTVEYIDWD